jgi:hypothetical protein
LKVPPSMKSSPEGDIIRGTSVEFTIENLPSDLPVLSWTFEETLSSGKVLRVKRPKKEKKKKTWQTSWKGQMVTSGKIVVRYESVRTKVKDEAGVVRWRVEIGRLEHAVNVVPRTGDDWSSTVTRHEEQPWNKPPNKYEDLGRHISEMKPKITWRKRIPIVNVKTGPNKGYKFVNVLKVSFHSRALINNRLINPKSKFSEAQDGNGYIMKPKPMRKIGLSEWSMSEGKITAVDDEQLRKKYNIPVYKTKPTPKKRLDPSEWTISGDEIQLTDENKFLEKYKIPLYITWTEKGKVIKKRVKPGDWTFAGNNIQLLNEKKYGVSGKSYKYKFAKYALKGAKYDLKPRISHEKLLEYTRRHEYQGDPISHRANFEKMVRALDPKKYAESLISRPGEKISLLKLVKIRITKTVKLGGATHRIVDEDATEKNGREKYKPKKWKVEYEPNGDWMIYWINADDSGDLQGEVWNPIKKKFFPPTKKK